MDENADDYVNEYVIVELSSDMEYIIIDKIVKK